MLREMNLNGEPWPMRVHTAHTTCLGLRHSSCFRELPYS